MRNLLLVASGVVLAILLVGGGWVFMAPSGDQDPFLVHADAPPDDFPLALLPEAEGTLIDAMTREVSGMKTVTLQYQLAEGVDESALLERYAALIADIGGRPERRASQVRATMPQGLVTAQLVKNEQGPVLTLQAVRAP